MPQQIITIPFNNQEIGQGFNSETGLSIGTGLSIANIGEDKVADGQDVSTSFQIVSDQDSLKEALGISAQLDARYLLFSADAKVSFTESHAVNSYSSFVAGRCLVKNAQRHGHGFQLTPDAAAVLKQDTASGSNRFKTAFGDMFVRALNTGGEFLVVARVTSISEDHQRNLAASLHGEYQALAAGVSFSAAYNKAMTETQNHTEVSVWMTQRGGQEAQEAFTGPEATKILARLTDFPTSAHQHPVGYEAELATYETIPIPVPPLIVKEAYERVLADCLQQKMGFVKALSDLALALSDQTSMLFDGLPSKDDLDRMMGQYRTALSALLSHAIRVSTGQMDPPQFFVANPAPPAVSFKKKPHAQIQVPNLLGISIEDAQTTLRSLGLQAYRQWGQSLEWAMQHFPHQQPPGIVFHQTPDAGTMVAPDSLVKLFANAHPDTEA